MWRLAALAMLFYIPLESVAQDAVRSDPMALAERLAAVTGQLQYRPSQWGVLFADVKSGAIVYEYQAEKLFAPASTTKLFTVATALHKFGAEYRFRTPLVRQGEVDADGVLHGNLILIASGDLSFGGRTNAQGGIDFKDSDHTYSNGNLEAELTMPSPLAALDDLAAQAAAAGIKRIDGDVLVDDRLFDHAEGSGSGPGRITPMLVNDNVIDITFAPGEQGQPARITTRPETAAFQFENLVLTGDEKTSLETWIRPQGEGRIRLEGKVPVGHKPVVRIHEVPNAAQFARTLLMEALARANIAVEIPLVRKEPETALPAREDVAGFPKVAEHVSPPLSESAKLILKVSHNLHASTLPLLVASRDGKRTLADGLRIQHDVLKAAGLDVDSISFGGGAGGARADYVTPRVTVQLLRYMATRPDFTAYRNALPRMGIDGTLSKTVGPASPIRGKVFAKTGTLYWDNLMNGRELVTSKALAGYMTTSSGRELAFAIFVNNVHTAERVGTRSIGNDLGRICEIVYVQTD